MSGPPPDPESRRSRAGGYQWVVLPMEGRQGDPPALPSWRPWSPGTLAWWSELWATPQATQWDQTGRTLTTAALLVEQLQGRAAQPASLFAELRQIEDRHGLNPKSMLQLRWTVGTPEVPATPPPPAVVKKAAARHAGALRILTGGDSSTPKRGRRS